MAVMVLGAAPKVRKHEKALPLFWELESSSCQSGRREKQAVRALIDVAMQQHELQLPKLWGGLWKPAKQMRQYLENVRILCSEHSSEQTPGSCRMSPGAARSQSRSSTARPERVVLFNNLLLLGFFVFAGAPFRAPALFQKKPLIMPVRI